MFIEVFEEQAAALQDVQWLAQGTIYPDVIESVSVNGPSATIKSHHNVGGLPERMNLELVEPLRELFKDEVRVAGRVLGLPDSILGRHPFPGPGLAVRVLGEIIPEVHRKARRILVVPGGQGGDVMGDKQKSLRGRFGPYISKQHPYSVYDFTESRVRDGPAKFLIGFQGYLHAEYDHIFLGSCRSLLPVFSVVIS